MNADGSPYRWQQQAMICPPQPQLQPPAPAHVAPPMAPQPTIMVPQQAPPQPGFTSQPPTQVATNN